MTSAIENSSRTGVFWTPPPKWETPPAAAGVPVMPCSENNARRSLYHAHYKVPPGDSPYGIAKRVQLVEKDPSKAVSLFWAAINSGDRVDSALKDMAVIMKQLNRSDEAIEAIKSFRHLCPVESQESLDNVLLELYKKSGKLQEEIQMLRLKLKHIEEVSFRGKRIKVGRSQGRKVHITIEKEYSRLLGNLAWAYLQQKNYRSAEEYYRKALSFEPDRNKQCNLAVCLMHLNMKTEARLLLQAVRTSCENAQIDDSFSRSFNRATQLLGDLESDHFPRPIIQKEKMYGEIQKPFLSCARRNLRRPSEADNGNKLLGSERLRNSKVVHQDEISPVIELKTPSLLQNLHDSNITFSSSFCRGIRHSNGQKEEALTCRKEYDPLFSLAKTPRVLTQPQKCLRLANKCSHGRRSYAEGPDGGCSRKLLFQHENNCESVQFSPYHNVHQYKEPESTRNLTSEDRRKKTLGDLVPKHRKCSMISISVGVWRRDCLEVDEQRKDTKSESSLSSITTFGGYSTRKEEFPECDEDSGRNSTVYRMGLIEAAENGNQIQKSTQKLKSNVEHLQDFPTSKKKKSWADMVEEGDQELLNESKDSLAHEQGFSSGESVVSPKNTPINYSHDNEAGEQFGDENRNPDIILETPCSLNQGESLNQKLKSLVPKDGYYTQPLHSGSSMNHTGRRLFCNDQYRNLDKIQTTVVSPLQKRSLNFI